MRMKEERTQRKYCGAKYRKRQGKEEDQRRDCSTMLW